MRLGPQNGCVTYADVKTVPLFARRSSSGVMTSLPPLKPTSAYPKSSHMMRTMFGRSTATAAELAPIKDRGENGGERRHQLSSCFAKNSSCSRDRLEQRWVMCAPGSEVSAGDPKGVNHRTSSSLTRKLRSASRSTRTPNPGADGTRTDPSSIATETSNSSSRSGFGVRSNSRLAQPARARPGSR